jgi:hypothetical protein
MDPQSAAHLIRHLRTIAIELRLANDIAARSVAYPNSASSTPTFLDDLRETYREEMS